MECGVTRGAKFVSGDFVGTLLVLTREDGSTAECTGLNVVRNSSLVVNNDSTVDVDFNVTFLDNAVQINNANPVDVTLVDNGDSTVNAVFDATLLNNGDSTVDVIFN